MVCFFVLLCVVGNVGDVFVINLFGFILVVKKLDREIKSVYELIIIVEDWVGIFFFVKYWKVEFWSNLEFEGKL